jgi:hypothetical protein
MPAFLAEYSLREEKGREGKIVSTVPVNSVPAQKPQFTIPSDPPEFDRQLRSVYNYFSNCDTNCQMADANEYHNRDYFRPKDWTAGNSPHSFSLFVCLLESPCPGTCPNVEQRDSSLGRSTAGFCFSPNHMSAQTIGIVASPGSASPIVPISSACPSLISNPEAAHVGPAVKDAGGDGHLSDKRWWMISADARRARAL